MKRMLLAATALSLLAADVAAAQSRGGDRRGGSGGGRSVAAQRFSAPAPQRARAPAPSQQRMGGARYDYRHGDFNHNGRVDRRFDRNRDGQIDRRFDRNNNDFLDRRFDRNRNGDIDRRFDRNNDNRIDRRWQHGNYWRDWRGGRGPWVNDRYWWRSHWYTPAYRRWYAPAYRWPYGWGYRRWSYGMILPSAFFLSNYFINNWWSYDLYEPPYGYVWIRVGPDILLVNPRNGRVMQVVSGAFYY
ncbi:MAG TPA: RcnB family protein [Caulobacteraceae bacterium]